jgi:hypothetical protein
MPTARLTAHRIATSWITKAALLAGSYLISDLTVVADQIVDGQVLIPWLAPTRESGVANYTSRDKLLTGQIKQYGFLQFNLKWSYWTFGQVGTWKALYTDSLKSQQVTVGLYDDTNVFQAIQCYMSPLDLPGESGEPAYGGYQGVVVEFLGGVIAPAS